MNLNPDDLAKIAAKNKQILVFACFIPQKGNFNIMSGMSGTSLTPKNTPRLPNDTQGAIESQAEVFEMAEDDNTQPYTAIKDSEIVEGTVFSDSEFDNESEWQPKRAKRNSSGSKIASAMRKAVSISSRRIGGKKSASVPRSPQWTRSEVKKLYELIEKHKFKPSSIGTLSREQCEIISREMPNRNHKSVAAKLRREAIKRQLEDDDCVDSGSSSVGS